MREEKEQPFSAKQPINSKPTGRTPCVSMRWGPWDQRALGISQGYAVPHRARTGEMIRTTSWEVWERAIDFLARIIHWTLNFFSNPRKIVSRNIPTTVTLSFYCKLLVDSNSRKCKFDRICYSEDMKKSGSRDDHKVSSKCSER